MYSRPSLLSAPHHLVGFDLFSVSSKSSTSLYCNYFLGLCTKSFSKWICNKYIYSAFSRGSIRSFQMNELPSRIRMPINEIVFILCPNQEVPTGDRKDKKKWSREKEVSEMSSRHRVKRDRDQPRWRGIKQQHRQEQRGSSWLAER